MSLLWIVDDEPVICSTLERTFENQGHQVRVFSAAEPAIKEASEIVQQSIRLAIPDLIVIDVRLPGMDGIAAISKLTHFFPDIPIVVMTAFGDLPTAVRAMEAKVFEYLTKPFDLDTAITTVERGLASCDSRTTAERSVEQTDIESTDHKLTFIDEFELFGSSPAMQTVFKRIAMAAITDCPVLICGESGTGKELVARAIHRHSARQHEPYLAVAPVTLNPALIESELFGHERGAFTGADQTRRGVFELAGQGTILLDEIGDLPLAQQVKLLRVLEQREYLPVGSSKPKEVRSRVLAATHRNLSQMVNDGDFREDLYFRLAVFTIELPSLRERRGDIVPLALRFLRRHGYPATKASLADEAVVAMETYAWPGNVRELRNAMDHAAVLARGNRIYCEHLPNMPGNGSDNAQLNDASFDSRLEQIVRNWVMQQEARLTDLETSTDSESQESEELTEENIVNSLYARFLSAVEPPLIRALLDSSQGNRAVVAQKLGLHRSTLRQKMRNYQMEP